MKTLDYLPDSPNTGGWQDRHKAAIRATWLGLSQPFEYHPLGQPERAGL